jgi:DnaJ family protein A protein 2
MQHDSDNTGFYKELGVSPKADDDEIRKVYKKKMMKLHPNKGGDPEQFKRIQEIYEVLSDKHKRQTYDQYGEEGLKDVGDMGSDPFSAFFGGGNRHKRHQQPVKRKCKVRLVQHSVTLEEVYSGVKKTIEFSRRVNCKPCNGTGSDNPAAVRTCDGCKGHGVRMVMQRMGGMLLQSQQVCPECQGQGKINGSKCDDCKGDKITYMTHTLNLDIEKGTYDGYRFNFIDEGDMYPEIETGDVVVEVTVEPHKVFTRVGADLKIKRDITLLEALTGVSFVLTHLDGKKILVKNDVGEIVNPGVLKTLREKGMPFYNMTFKYGNLYIEFNILFPKALEIENSAEILEKVLLTRLNKNTIGEKEEVERYEMKEFKLEDENTHHGGGKKESHHDDQDDDDERGQGQQQCQQQ